MRVEQIEQRGQIRTRRTNRTNRTHKKNRIHRANKNVGQMTQPEELEQEHK